MSTENKPELVNSARMPKDVHEQLSALPCDEERGEICEDLAIKIFALLSNSGVLIENGSMRVKTREKIEKKITRRNSTAPLRDIYGIRFITEEKNRARIAKIIQDQFPLTPANFEDGMPSVREYADPEVREHIKAHFNPRISDRHSAMHINIVFQREGANIYDIAEVQILTPDEMKIFKETRGEYENGRH